jgi:hypothetical protein
MIDAEIFQKLFPSLAAYHKHELNPDFIPAQYEILSEALTTEEFQQAFKKMLRRKFFPSLDEIIDSVLGTLEERAIAQLDNLDRLSVVGRKALNSIGGEWNLTRSSHYDLLRRDFIASYIAFAKFAKPEDLRMPDPMPAIAPADGEFPNSVVERYFCFIPHGTRVTESGKYEFLWQYKGFQDEITAEEIQKIFLDVIEKSAQRSRLNRIIDGVHILKDPSPTLLRAFNSPDHQKVIELIKTWANIALAAQKKQQESA